MTDVWQNAPNENKKTGTNSEFSQCSSSIIFFLNSAVYVTWIPFCLEMVQSFASTSTLWNCQEIQSISCLVVFRKIVKTAVFRKRKVHCTWKWDVCATSTSLVLILFILFIFVCINCFIFVVCGSLFYKLILLAAQPLGIVSIKEKKIIVENSKVCGDLEVGWFIPKPITCLVWIMNSNSNEFPMYR